MSYLATRRSLLVAPAAAAATDWWLAGGISSGDCVAAYAAVGAASQTASKTNLANPGTYDLADGSATPTWNATDGWIWDGFGTVYYDTGWYPVETSSIIIRYSDLTSGGYTFLAGVQGSSPTRWYFIYPFDGSTYGIVGFSAGSYQPNNLSLSGTAALAKNVFYSNGSSLNTISYSWNGDPGIPLPIGARHAYGGYYGDSSAKKIQAVAIYSIQLSADQIAALHTAMMAL